MLKAYKYRLYPNRTQQVLMEKHFGCARFVYNWALALQNAHYKAHGKSLPRSEIQRQLVAKKKEVDFAWLNEVNSQSLLNALLNLHTAFANFFKGHAKFPTFKSKHYSARSYQNPQHCTVDVAQGVINLPKLKGVKARFSRTFDGLIKTVTVSKSATGKYYASVNDLRWRACTRKSNINALTSIISSRINWSVKTKRPVLPWKTWRLKT